MGDRVKVAQAEAVRRFHREGRQFVPLRLWVIGIVGVVAVTSKPSIGLEGRHLALTICLVVFIAEMLWWPLLRTPSTANRFGELLVMGASAIAIVALQPSGVAELPCSAVLFTAAVVLPPTLTIALGVAISVGIVAAFASAGGIGGASIAASVLLCVVLGFTGSLLRRHRLAQDRTELLLAELEEARDDQARAAAAEERASIARELHDVLAHSLSGLSIQLEVARKVASSTDAPSELRDVIDGAADIAKQGLVEARAAVGALRRDGKVGLERLSELVEHFRRDLGVDVSYRTDGVMRQMSAELGLALYRVAGEALTNVVRHASGAVVSVELAYAAHEVRLMVSDSGGAPSAIAAEGGGWGLIGLGERLKRLGGDLVAGPSGSGWLVVASAPA